MTALAQVVCRVQGGSPPVVRKALPLPKAIFGVEDRMQRLFTGTFGKSTIRALSGSQEREWWKCWRVDNALAGFVPADRFEVRGSRL